MGRSSVSGWSLHSHPGRSRLGSPVGVGKDRWVLNHPTSQLVMTFLFLSLLFSILVCLGSLSVSGLFFSFFFLSSFFSSPFIFARRLLPRRGSRCRRDSRTSWSPAPPCARTPSCLGLPQLVAGRSVGVGELTGKAMQSSRGCDQDQPQKLGGADQVPW